MVGMGDSSVSNMLALHEALNMKLRTTNPIICVVLHACDLGHRDR